MAADRRKAGRSPEAQKRMEAGDAEKSRARDLKTRVKLAAAREVTDLAAKAEVLADDPEEAAAILKGLLWREQFEADRRARGIPEFGLGVNLSKKVSCE